MKDIPFEKVSLEEAIAAANTGFAPAAAPVSKAVRNDDWARLRQSAGAASHELSGEAFAWLSKLPKEKRPNHLARQFPRIVNQLAGLWKRPLRCELYLDNLALDLRGGRRGFPAEIAAEIVMLKDYFTTVVAPVRYDVWGERIGMADE